MSDLFPPKYSSATRSPGIPRSIGLASLPARALRLVAPARRLPSFTATHSSAHNPQLPLLHDMRNALCSLGIIADFLQEPGILSSGNQHIATSVTAVTKTLRNLVESLATASSAESPKVAASHSPEPSAKSEQQLTSPPIAIDPAVPPPATSSAYLSHERVHVVAALPAGEAIQSCGSMLRAVAGELVPVYISSEQALPPLAMPTAQLERVFMNLVRNSADAMPAGGLVRITARRALSRTSPAILIHVSDNGPGIPAHALPLVFQPGFSSKGPLGNAGQPSGLGLSIVRELVESCGGSVQVASTRHRGTTFELRIPCLQPQTSQDLLPV